MGDLLRLYWIPFLFSWEVEPDGSPERVRLLGEDLIAFRDSSGEIGLIQNNCPHRGASLFFGRNEEIQASAACTTVGSSLPMALAWTCPTSPPSRTSSTKSAPQRIHASNTLELFGPIWDRSRRPLHCPVWSGWIFRRPSWLPPNASRTPTGCKPWKAISTRAIFRLHTAACDRRRIRRRIRVSPASANLTSTPASKSCGRAMGPASLPAERPRTTHRYWRITQHLMPFHTMTGPYGKDPLRNWRAWVPIDDVTCFVIGVTFHPRRPLTHDERTRPRTPTWVWTISPEHRSRATSQPFGRWRSTLDLHNDFEVDRHVQQTENFSGIRETWAQDAAPQVSMGRINDRTVERLGTSDLAIITVRRRLLEAAKALRARGVVPGEISEPASYAVRSDALLLRAEQKWFDATTERRRARPGVNPDCA